MPDFVILSNSPWNSKGRGGNSSQQYARAVMRRGWRVSYHDKDGLTMFTPLEELALGPQVVVMCDMPWVEHYYRIFQDLQRQGCKTVYRVVDHWGMTPRREDYCEAREIAFITAADAVFASSPLNVERFRAIRPDITLLRNGADLETFWGWQGEPPADLRRGQPTLAFVTSLWEPDWVDWEALFCATESRPELALNLLADIGKLPPRKLPENFNAIGIRPWSGLPAYLTHCDVGLIAYRPGLTRYNNPLKALEYLACGLPVVSSPNPSIMDHPYLCFYNNTEEFMRAIDQAAAMPVNREYLYAYLQQHTWDRRLEEILGKLAGSSISPETA